MCSGVFRCVQVCSTYLICIWTHNSIFLLTSTSVVPLSSRASITILLRLDTQIFQRLVVDFYSSGGKGSVARRWLHELAPHYMQKRQMLLLRLLTKRLRQTHAILRHWQGLVLYKWIKVNNNEAKQSMRFSNALT